MTGETVVPEEAVEAAVDSFFKWLTYVHPESKADMRAALEAAAPFIAAKALEDAAADAPTRHDEVISAEECRDWAEWLRARAAAVRGEG